MKKQFTSLLEYEKWANERILDALAQLKEPDEKCLEIMAHILLVQMVWYSRMEDKAAPPIWAKKSLKECLETLKVNNMLLEGFMAKQTEDTLMRAVKYQNSKGEKFNNLVIHILTHLFNHSTYHLWTDC